MYHSWQVSTYQRCLAVLFLLPWAATGCEDVSPGAGHHVASDSDSTAESTVFSESTDECSADAIQEAKSLWADTIRAASPCFMGTVERDSVDAPWVAAYEPPDWFWATDGVFYEDIYLYKMSLFEETSEPAIVEVWADAATDAATMTDLNLPNCEDSVTSVYVQSETASQQLDTFLQTVVNQCPYCNKTVVTFDSTGAVQSIFPDPESSSDPEIVSGAECVESLQSTLVFPCLADRSLELVFAPFD